jgi:hypothetical protein
MVLKNGKVRPINLAVFLINCDQPSGFNSRRLLESCLETIPGSDSLWRRRLEPPADEESEDVSSV